MVRLGFLLAIALVLAISLFALARAQEPSAELFNYPDTVINGFDSATLPNKSIDECRHICATRSGCAGFEYSEKGSCRILASIGSARPSTGSISETRNLIPGYRDPTNPPFAMLFEKLKQTDNEGGKLLALGRDAYAHGDRNIGSQAINLAMQRGNQEAKIEIAQWYDPRTFAADRVAAIDANKAARSYFELALEGNSRANTLLTSLCREADNSGSAYASAFGNFLGSTYCEGSLNP